MKIATVDILTLILYILSLLCSIWFFIHFAIKRKNIAKIEINRKELENYVGKKSYVYKEYCCESKSCQKDNCICPNAPESQKIERLIGGISKNLRFFYSTWFWTFFIITVGLSCSIVNIFYSQNIDFSKIMQSPYKHKIPTCGTESAKYIYANIENIANSENIKIAEDIITNYAYLKDLKLPLVLRVQSSSSYFWSGIIKDYPLKDTITFQIDNIPYQTDTVIHGKSKIYKIKFQYQISKHQLADLKNNRLREKLLEYNKLIKDTSNVFYRVKPIDKVNNVNLSSKFFVFETKTKINKITTEVNNSINYFDKKKQEFKDSISNIDEKKQAFENRLAKLYNPTPVIVKNIYQTSTTILSLLSNVVLLFFFGFLNTKTDLFGKEGDSKEYLLFKNVVIVIFFIILLIKTLGFLFPEIHFSKSFSFIIDIIIALTSVIALFGCWGSINNSYMSFKGWGWFIFLMLFYAMTQNFEINSMLSNNNNKLNDWIEFAFAIIRLLSKVFIIIILLYSLPKNKRALWSFFSLANNIRTKEDYEDFQQIFVNDTPDK
jgi:hypothetical protein